MDTLQNTNLAYYYFADVNTLFCFEDLALLCTLSLFTWSKQKWLFWRAGFYSANQSNLKSFQKSLNGWKKPALQKNYFSFDHVNRLTILILWISIFLNTVCKLSFLYKNITTDIVKSSIFILAIYFNKASTSLFNWKMLQKLHLEINHLVYLFNQMLNFLWPAGRCLIILMASLGLIHSEQRLIK